MIESALVERFFHALGKRGWRFVTAESLTAGLLSASCASVSGASRYLWGGFVTYSNEAKMFSLGVSPSLLADRGAVSAEVVIAMAEGALEKSGVELAISLSGLAEAVPGDTTPSGTVWMAVSVRGEGTTSFSRIFPGGRNEVREQAVEAALEAAVKRLA